MTEKHANLAAALAAFQLSLPKVGKGNTAKVTSDKGNYSYKYADLSDVSAVVLPALAAHGLSFSSKPTLTDDGRFVLAYVLRHEIDGEDAGTYPLPSNGTPQSIGSAISYARRYVLSAISGVAPDEDDDGQAANAQHEYTSQRGQGNQKARSGTSEAASPPIVSKEAREALEELAAVCDAMSLDRELVAAEFARRHNGADVRKAATPEAAGLVRAFIAAVDDMDPTKLKSPVAATNGAAQ